MWRHNHAIPKKTRRLSDEEKIVAKASTKIETAERRESSKEESS